MGSRQPVLAVGSRRIAGFQDAAWQDAPSAAACPRSGQLPPGYRFAPPQATGQPPRPPSRQSGNAPPGFPF